MSKSEWKELPDWENAVKYDFMDGEPPEVWAWEFLRRYSRYRRCWELLTVNGLLTHPIAKVYRPRRLQNESDTTWERRTALDTGAIHKPLPVDVYFGQKWGLQKIHSPLLSYTTGVSFIRQKDFPRLIHTPDDFMTLLEDEECDSNLFQHVANQYAVVGFDIGKPVSTQIAAAKAMLLSWQERMETDNRLDVERHSGKPFAWKQHLRVLDARRTGASYLQIGEAFIDNNKQDKKRRGEKMTKSALDAVKNYRKILLYAGKPLEKNNS